MEMESSCAVSLDSSYQNRCSVPSSVSLRSATTCAAAARDQLYDYMDEMSPYGYQPFTMEELLDELMRTSYLFDSVPYFFPWASKVLAAKTSAKKNAGKSRVPN